ncbi:ABC-F family ATP-binding cassette domain-containing protein [Desulfocapsa sp. AH-315-G09]|uniref:ABC-F family ATP-binding cassette domain-containing protein n=1 Tax=Desulfotalea psychrophila TaxID=84980 RepID=A0ABS3AU67_9BACT|nr:ABC-F family ATP-binding cassette domain-containing protein [Desulfocapsa sp.]MBN4045916.1 ABC-F family ATP-binding cassette domain-containing protein [bacterium AH-315-P11]MBN4048630.1 ABC-F family ATP-binding cassette domain-containing protein [bacterium AH-315-N22]MBN4065584.1 ABC-F family ATP-binding cassette domain-containing protein [Desulfocapsa sp. AH-315-G09]MBN4068284.1 ABC-F family ATP-binding cassette domain-containing protein [Desulfotalea psychrophila]
MSNLLVCQGLGKSFGSQNLFRNIDLVINKGDRVGLIGPNGSGKSTLLKIICGRVDPDDGQVLCRKTLRTAYLAQADQFMENATVAENLEAALDSLDLDEIERYNRVQALLSRAEFPDSSIAVKLLSGGWRKRLAICRSFVVEPDILVMDEPTNHLDIEGVLWLERMLSGSLPKSPDAFLLVSHDRRFLENSTNRMVELSSVYPDGSLQVQGNYSTFLEARVEFLAQQQNLEERLANKMRRETEWLSRGPKARATKARYRIDEAHKLQSHLSEVKGRNRSVKQVRIDFDSTGRKTKKLLEAKGISKRYEGRTLFSDLDLVLSPGTRLGLLGRNGCGKSTLMQIIAASASGDGCQSDTGTIQTAPDVRIVSFDQKRESINPEITLRRALAPDGDSIVFRESSIHVVSWAQRFLFRPDQLETPVGQLSGGEQARILIAELMRQSADILLLDEPTNDLDIPSLDVLEESLLDFPGALVLVSHDRFLLDSVCDQVIGFDGDGGVAFYADYEQWLADLRKRRKEQSGSTKSSQDSSVSKKDKQKKARKLSYMDQREYDQIEEKIMEGEEEQERLQALMDAPETAIDSQLLESVWADLEQAKLDVGKLYERWDELEEKRVDVP